MLDRDLAELYGVETKALKQAVRRNIKRFPEDFMFELSTEEFTNWRSQIVTSNRDKMGLRYSPMAFTLHTLHLSSSLPREMPLIISLGQSVPRVKRSFCLTPFIRALSLDTSKR